MGTLNHEEHRDRVASELSVLVEQPDAVVGNSTWRSAATNFATLDAAAVAQAAPTNIAIHETDKAIFQIFRRNLKQAVDAGRVTDSDIASMNDLASSRAVFTNLDSSLAGSGGGQPHRAGGRR